MKKLILLSVAALGMVATPALADDHAMGEGTGDGFFVAAGGVMYDNNDIMGVQGTVGYNFAKYFGVEGVVSTGLVDADAGGGIKVGVDSSFAGFGVLRLASDKASVYVKGGYHSTKFGASAGTLTGDLTLDGIGGGLGVDWYFNEHSGVRFEAVSYDTKDLNIQGVNGMTLISLSYLHKF